MSWPLVRRAGLPCRPAMRESRRRGKGPFCHLHQPLPGSRNRFCRICLSTSMTTSLCPSDQRCVGGALRGYGKQVNVKRKENPSPAETDSLVYMGPKPSQPSFSTFHEGPMQDAGDTGQQNIHPCACSHRARTARTPCHQKQKRRHGPSNSG